MDLRDYVRALSAALMEEKGLLREEVSVLIRRSKVAEKKEKTQICSCYINGTRRMVLGGMRNECIKTFLHVLRHFSLFSGHWSP